MLIRLMEYNWTENDDSGLDNPHFIKAYTEKNINKVIKLIKEIKGVRIGNDWYTICDYIWNFPESYENIPSLDIYVVEGYEES